MFLIKNLTEIVFSIGIFVNATLFIPQAIRVLRQKHTKDLSLTTFAGFNVMQLASSSHGFFHGDYLLAVGSFLSFLTCGAVTLLILRYRYNEKPTLKKKIIITQPKTETGKQLSTKTKVGFVDAHKEKDKIPGSKYVMPISVGQPYHEGEKFAATIDCLNSRGFSHCTLVVASTLQRHTLALKYKSLSDSELYEKSIENGVKWLDNNIPLLKQLNHPLEIIDWDTLVNNEKFEKKLVEINDTYRNSEIFRQAVDKTIDDFIARWQKKKLLLSEELLKARTHCRQYLFEECAVVANWAGLGYRYEIYPVERTDAMNFVHRNFIFPNYPDELKRISLRFRKKPQSNQENSAELRRRKVV